METVRELSGRGDDPETGREEERMQKEHSGVPIRPTNHRVAADFREGDAAKHFSINKEGFSVKMGGGNSVNEGFGKDFYRRGNSVKRSGPFSGPQHSED